MQSSSSSSGRRRLAITTASPVHPDPPRACQWTRGEQLLRIPSPPASIRSPFAAPEHIRARVYAYIRVCVSCCCLTTVSCGGVLLLKRACPGLASACRCSPAIGRGHVVRPCCSLRCVAAHTATLLCLLLLSLHCCSVCCCSRPLLLLSLCCCHCWPWPSWLSAHACWTRVDHAHTIVAQPLNVRHGCASGRPS